MLIDILKHDMPQNIVKEHFVSFTCLRCLRQAPDQSHQKSVKLQQKERVAKIQNRKCSQALDSSNQKKREVRGQEIEIEFFIRQVRIFKEAAQALSIHTSNN